MLTNILKVEHADVFVCSDAIGGCTVANDTRWAGAYGVNVDFVAQTHCSVEVVAEEDIQVCL